MPFGYCQCSAYAVFCQYWCSVASSLAFLWRCCSGLAATDCSCKAWACDGPWQVCGLAGARVHWWQAWWLDLCCAEGGIDVCQCSGVCKPRGTCPCKPSKAAVSHWQIGGCKGPECVTHDALSGLNHMPITSD